MSGSTAYFPGVIIANKLFLFLAWAFVLCVIGPLLFSLGNGFISLGKAVQTTHIREMMGQNGRESLDRFDHTNSKRISYVVDIHSYIKASTAKAKTRKAITAFEDWTPRESEYINCSISELQLLLDMYNEVIEITPSTYRPKEIEKGTADQRVAKLRKLTTKLKSAINKLA